jgi:hypothetical protein
MNEPQTPLSCPKQEEAAVAERASDGEPVRERVCNFESLRPDLLSALEDPF